MLRAPAHVAPRSINRLAPASTCCARVARRQTGRPSRCRRWRGCRGGGGRRSYPPALADLVAYWRRYHLVKAAFAVPSAIALCWLAHILWRSPLQAGRLRPATTAAAVASGSAVTALAFGSVLVVMATIQGSLAPFSSLVSLLPIGHGDPALTESAGQIQHDLSEHQVLSRTPAPLGAIIGDFQRYHAVLAAQAAVLAVALIGLSVLMWRRSNTAGRAVPRAKPLLRLLATAFALFTVIVLVVDAANVSTALNPGPALRLVFGG